MSAVSGTAGGMQMFLQLLPTAVAALYRDYVLGVVKSWLRHVGQGVEGIVSSECGGVPPL
jgi:hypothetical protein